MIPNKSISISVSDGGINNVPTELSGVSDVVLVSSEVDDKLGELVIMSAAGEVVPNNKLSVVIGEVDGAGGGGHKIVGNLPPDDISSDAALSTGDALGKLVGVYVDGVPSSEVVVALLDVSSIAPGE